MILWHEIHRSVLGEKEDQFQKREDTETNWGSKPQIVNNTPEAVNQFSSWNIYNSR